MADEQAVAEEKVANLIFGEEESTSDEVPVAPQEAHQEIPEIESIEGDDDYQPDPKPVVEGEEPELVEFEWDGQLLEAPPQIKEALMRQSDYTQKTQELATERKTIEVQAENLKLVNSQYEFARQVQNDIIEAHGLEQQIEQTRTYLRDNVDQLNSTDITKIQMAISDAQAKRDTIINAVTSKNTEFQQAHEQTRKELATKSTEVLRQKVPGWDASHETKIRDYALSLGVPEQTYNSVVDPIEKEILFKAMQYDALKSGVTPAVKKVRGAPTIKTKSRNPMDQGTQDKLSLRKKIKNSNRSVQDRANLIGLDIANRLKI